MSKLTCPLRMSAVRTTRLAMAHPGHQHDPQRDTRPWQVSRPTQPSTSAVRGGASLGTCPLVRRSAFQVKRTSWSQGLSVTTGGSGVVPLAGAVALRRDFGLITGQLPAGSRNLISD